jgi:hypothetical protein
MKYQRTLKTRNHVAAIFLCISFLIGVRAQTVSLQLQNTYSSGETTMTPFIVATDLNKDGYDDVLSINSGSNNYVGYSVNNGGGAFGVKMHSHMVRTQLRSRLAILTGMVLMIWLSAHRILPAGSISSSVPELDFTPGPIIGTTTTVESVSSIATADFNGDGNLDLAFTKVGGYNTAPDQCTSSSCSETARGNFSGLVSFAAGFGGGRNIVVSDFNVDGRPDIAMPAQSAINIYLNNGAGGFTAAPDVTNVTLPNKIVAADFNRDCIPTSRLRASARATPSRSFWERAAAPLVRPLVIP